MQENAPTEKCEKIGRLFVKIETVGYISASGGNLMDSSEEISIEGDIISIR